MHHLACPVEREMQLAIRKMELEVEKEIQFRELELHVVKRAPGSFIPSDQKIDLMGWR